MFSIEPIKLLSGSHKDTATTGSGCFMNVIAYLNGEPQITDTSPCVCAVIRPVAIFLNDLLPDSERQRMIPFIFRAMGSATDDRKVMRKRAHLLLEIASTYMRIVNHAITDEFRKLDSLSLLDRLEQPQPFAERQKCLYAATDSMLSAGRVFNRAEEALHGHNDSADAANETVIALNRLMSAMQSLKLTSAANNLVKSLFDWLDAVCPAADEPTAAVIERAQKLVELAS